MEQILLSHRLSEGAQILCILRLLVAKVAAFYSFFFCPTSLVVGTLGDILKYFSGSQVFLTSLLYPLLSTEMVISTLVLIGIWWRMRACLLPWLGVNFLGLMLCSMGVAASLTGMLTDTDTEPATKTTLLLAKIYAGVCLLILSLGLLLLAIQWAAVFRLYTAMDPKKPLEEKKTTMTFFKRDHQPSTPDTTVSMYSATVLPDDLPDPEESPLRPSESGPGEASTLVSKEEEDSRSSWNTFKFTFDNEKFS